MTSLEKSVSNAEIEMAISSTLSGMSPYNMLLSGDLPVTGQAGSTLKDTCQKCPSGFYNMISTQIILRLQSIFEKSFTHNFCLQQSIKK